MKRFIALGLFTFFYGILYAQTFTMGKDCREKNATAIGMLKEKKFDDALNAFASMETSCKTKDAKEIIATGKAEALNGLGRYDEAIVASDAALRLTKNKSLNGYFQKAVAQAKLGQFDVANETFGKVLALTEKNQDVKAKASNFSLMAALHERQLGNRDSAAYFLDKAIALDPSNVNFVIQKGDMYANEKNYEQAFVQYDQAVSMGKSDLEMYNIRTNARMRMVQEKYNTTNTQELRSKMNDTEKEQVCTELKKAISLGMRDMKKDMFSSLVCK